MLVDLFDLAGLGACGGGGDGGDGVDQREGCQLMPVFGAFFALIGTYHWPNMVEPVVVGFAGSVFFLIEGVRLSDRLSQL
jgi:hypothetical protein